MCCPWSCCYLHHLRLLRVLSCDQSSMRLGTMSSPKRPKKKRTQRKTGQEEQIDCVIIKQNYLFWTRDITSICQDKTAELVEVLHSPLFPLWGLKKKQKCRHVVNGGVSPQKLLISGTRNTRTTGIFTAWKTELKEKTQKYIFHMPAKHQNLICCPKSLI